MELIIGGAFQGQLEYAREKYPGLSWTDGRSCTRRELYEAEAVSDFHEWVRRSVSEGEDISSLVEELSGRNPDLLIVSNEVGYGIVPVDAFEREWREAVGRVSCRLAAASRRVTRVVCGIGTVIKDA